MSKIAMNNIRHSVRENTCEMETEEYVSFMRELSEWATSQADMAEYTDSLEIDE